MRRTQRGEMKSVQMTLCLVDDVQNEEERDDVRETATGRSKEKGGSRKPLGSGTGWCTFFLRRNRTIGIVVGEVCVRTLVSLFFLL